MGFGPMFEYPFELIKAVMNQNINISEAARRTGLTEHEYIGHHVGVIGILTKGVIRRTTYTEMAVHAALVQLLNPLHYGASTDIFK